VRGARRLEVTVTDARGRPLREESLARWLERAAPAGARGAVSVALVSDAHMRRLNAAYRGENHATDVLSFRTAPQPQPTHAPAVYVGDLAIARGVAGRQARRSGHSLGVELRILALHGLLHLLGYDHETDAGTMRRLEDRLRRRARLPTGLVARVGRGRRASRTTS
jgi:probable rRNA maturation factor